MAGLEGDEDLGAFGISGIVKLSQRRDLSVRAAWCFVKTAGDDLVIFDKDRADLRIGMCAPPRTLCLYEGFTHEALVALRGCAHLGTLNSQKFFRPRR